MVVYILLTISFGYTMLVTETAIGRKTGQSPINAFAQLSKKYSFIGVMATLVPMIILPYYCVIGGWVVKYLIAFLTEGSSIVAADGYFTGFISSTQGPILWLAIFVLLTFWVVIFGVEKGVEKVSRTVMPLLILLSIFIAIYSATRPGAIEGLKYLFIPDFSKLSVTMIVAACGQMFFSLSIAMGIMITYGSYMGKDVNMEKVTGQVELFDTGIAILAGMMIIPAVFAFYGGDETHLNAGPSLMFITLPKVFDSMGWGTMIGIAFFVLVLFAALTSAIALMETVVSTFRDRFHLSRRNACIGVAIYTILVALPSSLGFGLWSNITILGLSFLDFFDFLSNAVLMPLTALAICLFVWRVLGIQVIVDEVELSSPFKRKRLYTITIKYIAPVLLVSILISSILNAFQIINL